MCDLENTFSKYFNKTKIIVDLGKVGLSWDIHYVHKVLYNLHPRVMWRSGSALEYKSRSPRIETRHSIVHLLNVTVSFLFQRMQRQLVKKKH